MQKREHREAMLRFGPLGSAHILRQIDHCDTEWPCCAPHVRDFAETMDEDGQTIESLATAAHARRQGFTEEP